MNSKYILDPSKACSIHSNINDFNNCYVETISAFKQIPNNSVIFDDDKLNKKWKKEIEKKMAEMPTESFKKRNFTNLDINVAPVFIDHNNKHFFPLFLNKVNTRHTALSLCEKECGEDEQCLLNCYMDFNSLKPNKNTQENYEKSSTIKPIPVYQVPPPNNLYPIDETSLQEIQNDNPTLFWTTFIITSIVLCLVIVIFLSVILAKKTI